MTTTPETLPPRARPENVCAVCGKDWAVLYNDPRGPGDPDDPTPVHIGRCWQVYTAKKKEDRAERDLIETLRRWGTLS